MEKNSARFETVWVKSSRQSQPVFESAYPPIADKNFGESDFAILMSAFPWWSQMIDATLYLQHRDGVYSDGSKSSSRFQYGGENRDVGSLAAR